MSHIANETCFSTSWFHVSLVKLTLLNFRKNNFSSFPFKQIFFIISLLCVLDGKLHLNIASRFQVISMWETTSPLLCQISTPFFPFQKKNIVFIGEPKNNFSSFSSFFRVLFGISLHDFCCIDHRCLNLKYDLSSRSWLFKHTSNNLSMAKWEYTRAYKQQIRRKRKKQSKKLWYTFSYNTISYIVTLYRYAIMSFKVEKFSHWKSLSDWKIRLLKTFLKNISHYHKS